jgi:hypothetical protein
MEDIIDVIDGAIRDATLGPDAMRWTPEAQSQSRRDDGLPPLAPGHCRVRAGDGAVLYEGPSPSPPIPLGDVRDVAWRLPMNA